MKTKSLIDNKWIYADVDRMPVAGETIQFTCNGRGRGGHCNVTATITKVNRKTVEATEAKCSYRQGTQWKVNIVDFVLCI